MQEVERVCETCDNYLGPEDPKVCAVYGCEPETLSMYCNVGFLQTLEASDEGAIKESFKTAAVPGQPEELGSGSAQPGTGEGQVLRVPRPSSTADEAPVPEEPEAEAPSSESLSKQRCLAHTQKGNGPQCKRDALPGKLFCGVASHKKQIEDGNIKE
jgi:hypothetical protein